MSTTNSNLFERILFEYPLLKRIVSELEPGEFRNLLLSGQVLPMSRKEANKFLISLKCYCGATNATRKVFKCIGTLHEPKTLDLEKIESYWSPLITICNDECKPWFPLGKSHMACCQFCRDESLRSERAFLDAKSKNLRYNMRYRMCKTHCLENFRPLLALPKEKCRCKGFLREEKGWRCGSCLEIAYELLNKRGENFAQARRYRHTVMTFATQEPTFEYKPDEPGLDETCCMMDCKERVWEDVENEAFLVFCARCSTVYKEKDMDVVCGLGGRLSRK